MERNKKILMLCSKPLFPLMDGGCVGMYAIWKGLQLLGQDVEILTAWSYKHPLQKNCLPEGMNINGVYLNLKPNFLKAFLNLFSTRSYVLERFYSKEMALAVDSCLKGNDYEIVQIEGLFMTPYIPLIRARSKAKIVVRPANVECEIWDRLSRTAKGFKKAYYRLMSDRLRREEVFWLNQADLVLSLTQRDRNIMVQMGVRKPIQILGVGVPDTLTTVEIEPEQPSLFYIGAMNWMPNIEGLDWFLEKVWPKIYPQFPDLKFYIAGRYMSSKWRNAHYPQVVVIGEVEDAKAFMSSKMVMVVPILSGSGIRIKIIEGMAVGRPIITTSLGAEGLDYTEGENIWIADTEEDFAKGVIKAILNPQESRRVGENARRLVQTKHDIRKITQELIRYYNE